MHAAAPPVRDPRPTADVALHADVAAFGESLRREHQRFLAAAGEAASMLAAADPALGRTAALQLQLTRQFMDAQRSILLRHAEANAEVARIERDDAAARRPHAQRELQRAAAIEEHPAGSARTARAAAFAGGVDGVGTARLAESVDLVFQLGEPEGATARRQLMELLDGWWVAEQHEARAKVDDASARAAMHRHVAAVEAAGRAIVAVSPEVPTVASATGSGLPARVHQLLDVAAPASLDAALTALLATLDEQLTPTAARPPTQPLPLSGGAIIRFEPTAVIARHGSDAAFHEFWTATPVAPAPTRRPRWWRHAAVVLPATVVASFVTVLLARVG